MKKMILSGVLLALVGCADKPAFTYTVEEAKTKAPASVKERCEPIDKKMVKVKGQPDSVPMGDLTKQADYVIGLYSECAERDAAKANWIESQGY